MHAREESNILHLNTHMPILFKKKKAFVYNASNKDVKDYIYYMRCRFAYDGILYNIMSSFYAFI